MTSNCRQICTLTMEIQDAFLDTPELRMSLAEAERRFHADTITCGAVLGVLVDARVLLQRADGAYESAFSQPHRRLVH